jgi:SpoVK/Ycf46/Vps4 family AAA+-type ATPase
MKQKKSFFNKFHRKYLFLQNSLSDFLHWRTSNSLNQADFGGNRPIQKKHESVFFEQEKISFQEYWKSTENRKIKSALQNRNTNISSFSLKRKKKVEFSDFPTNFEKTSFVQNSLNTGRFFKKNNGLKNSQTKLLSLNSFNFPKNSIFSKKLLKKSFHEKKKYITFQKKLKKIKNFEKNHSNFETFILESDCFRNLQPFPFFANQKIGQFFSKKTIFQQYWIFPLLGFVVLFSSPSSFLNSRKTTVSENLFEQKMESFAGGSFQKKKSKINLLPLNFLDSKKTTEIQKLNFQTEKNLKLKQLMNFSYFENSSKTTYLQFQKREAHEFQEFCNFYLKFFEKTMPSFFIDEKQYTIFQKQVLFESNLQFIPSMLKNAESQPTNFRKLLETKRNTFYWKWFSLNSNFSTVQQIHKFSNFLCLEIPQKGEFFSLKNSKYTTQESEHLNSKILPALDFSRAAFLFNEFEKDFDGPPAFSQFNQKDFLNCLEKEDSLFLQTFFSKKSDVNIFEKSSKNFFFLKKWLQTQNFWKVQKKEIIQTQFDFLSQYFNSEIKVKKVQKLNFLNKIQKEKFCFENLMNLDSLYLQKVFQNIQFKNRVLKTIDFTKSTNFSNFYKFLQKTQTFKNFKKISFLSKQINSSLKFKQQTFEFFVFQYYNALYKNTSTQQSLEKNLYFAFEFCSKKQSFDKIENFKTKNFLNLSFFNTRLNTILFEKRRLNKNSFFSPITELKLPIFLDFSNQAHLKNFSFFQKKKNFQSVENLKNRVTNTSSGYFHLSTLQKKAFNTFFERVFQQVPKFSESGLSQNKDDSFSQMFCEKKNSLKSNFYCSKNSFFEKSIENTVKNLKTTSFLNFLEFKSFQKSFLFEKMKKEEPFVFQNSQNYAIQNLSKNFTFQNSEKNSFFFKYSKSFVLKQKKDFFSSTQCANSLKKEIQNLKKKKFSFRSRKFEKIFKTFLSSLNKEKMERSFFQLDFEVEKNAFKNRLNAKKYFQLKLENDFFVLNTLSNSLKNNFKNQHFTFFVSSHPKIHKKDSFFPNSNFSFNSNVFLSQKFNKKNKFPNVQFESKVTRKKDLIRPTTLLKRDGFVSVPKYTFFVDLPLQKYSQNFYIQKKVKENFYLSNMYQKEQNGVQISRFEKEKAFQKKRRMKKQKLETRRRKKRKRFFPRPVWLRFHLYKKFFKIRHPDTGSIKNQKMGTGLFVPEDQEKFKTRANNFQNISFAFPKLSKNQEFKNFSSLKTRQFSFSKNLPENFFSTQKREKNIIPEKRWKNVFVSSFLKNQNVSHSKWKKMTTRSNFQKQANFYNVQQNHNIQEKKIFRKNRQKWGFSWKNGFQEKLFYKKFSFENTFPKKPNFFGGTEKSPISQNREDYKISGEILSEFLRFSWKSYWFQMNFMPYTRRITQNFRTMQQIESQKNFSGFDIFRSFGNQNYSNLFRGFSTYQNNVHESSQKDLFLKKALLKKFLWYCNIRNSFDSKSINAESLICQTQKSLNFQKIQNQPEYNRILYSRVSEILKNFKSSETNDQYFTRQTQKNLKIPKRKNEGISANSSFFTKFVLFHEHFNVPSQPSIPAFSMFSSLFHDSSIKPTGELPTLRALWALHQTNFYHFQEKNAVRNLWTLQKRTENLKSLKGTKKVVSYFRKYSGLEKFNAPKLLKASVFQNFLNENFSKQIEQNQKSYSFVLKPKQKMFQKNIDNHKIFILSTLKSGQPLDFIEQLDTMSLQKLRTVQEKCFIFGINTFKQNSKLSFRYLKFHLFSKMQNQHLALLFPLESFEKPEQSQTIEKRRVFQKNQLDQLTNDKKPNPQNSAKNSLNVWWCQKNEKNFEFLFLSENNSVHQPYFFPSFQFSQFQNFHSSTKQTNGSDLSSTNQMFFSSKETVQNFSGMQIQFLWFGALVFHLALFFSLFKLPEIRSVFKFKIILFYKFLNGFFEVLFSLYNLFKHYTKQGTKVVQKILHLSNFSLASKQSFVPYDFRRGKTPLQNFSVLRNTWVQEKNFENIYVSSLFDSKLSKIFLSTQKKSKQNSFFSPSTNFFELKNSTTHFFDVFVRLSEFSFSSFSQKSFFQNVLSNQKSESFFSSQKKRLHQSSFFGSFASCSISPQKFLNEENLPLFSSRLPLFTQKNKKNFFVLKQKLFFNEISPKNKTEQKFLQTKYSFLSTEIHPLSTFQILNQKLSAQSFYVRERKFQTLSKTEKIICQFALSFLIFGKSTTQMSYSFVRVCSLVSAKVFDSFETFLFSIYKFLEKPAELMIEWIALIFLIEWSSDMATFIPDTFDIFVTKSAQKFSRPIRSGSLLFSFLSLHYGNFNSPFSSNSGLFFSSPVLNSFTFFGSSNVLSYIFQKRMVFFFEHFSSVLTQPDMDILIRQRKGMIFWDIWAEILLKAAEKYNVNIPSFVTLKEEQELFIERLLQDKDFLKNLQIEKANSFFFHSNQKFENYNGEILQQKSLASFVENFLLKDRPTMFSEFGLSSRFFSKKTQKQTKNIHQSVLSSQTFSFAPFGFRFQNAKSFYKELQISSNFISGEDQSHFFFENSDRWACHQYGTYQGPETDLFVDIHPPKSLKHIQFFKYYEPAQYTLGSLICQIYSGIFSKRVAKNILVIGAPGTAKTLFIQALAGETEMKIITDNAYRYSMVQRGVAVGMKYLRDVFDALVLQTPCFFLMEHIHVIGSKRPFLISDDENVKGMQSSFGLDQQEVHETNQMIYQQTRHSISDYKRPYKGDFSMGIPTNFFIQNFYSKFEKSSTSIFKNSQFSTGGVNFVDRNSPLSPLPIDSIENSLFHQGFAEQEKAESAFQNSFCSESYKNGNFYFQSRLQMSKEQIFAPPATSPFTILMMKEQKKLKPKKIVQETSWGGLSTDQMISYQKENSSVRAKVAVLADLTMNLSRGKLDMITDLLVIIDNVRSNRGFVVFATTHLPSLLDPALRRPGRFDETILLAQSPNFLNRFEILKKNLENSVTTFDFLDSSIFTENFSELNLLNLITGTKLSLFHQYKYTSEIFENGSRFSGTLRTKFITSSTKQESKKIISQINPSKAFQSFLKSSFFHDLYSQKQLSFSFEKEKKSTLEIQKQKTNSIRFEEKNYSKKMFEFQNSKYFLRDFKLLKYTFLPKGPSHVLSLASSKIGIFLAKVNLLNDPTAFIPLSLDATMSLASFTTLNKQFLGTAFYGSQEQQKLQLMVFLSGKISEFFIQRTTKSSGSLFPFEKKEKLVDLKSESTKSLLFETSFEVFDRKFYLFPRQKMTIVLPKFQEKLSFEKATNRVDKTSKKQKPKTILSVFQKERNSSTVQKNQFFFTTFGNDQSWRSATPFIFAILQKRFLFTKNLLLSKMLFFENKNQRKLPPSPPNSSILMPSKKYENFKRTENDFVQKGRFSMNEKIQMHQQQRFLKQLYNIPVQQYFRSEVIQNRQTFFSSSFQELAYIDSLTRHTSSSHFYQRKYLGIRHRFSNVNQWWNGFLPEHTVETTYLSDVDWRTMFTSTKTQQKQTPSFKNSDKNAFSSENSFNQTFELTMDFPDAEQYYNPRNRRWYFHGKSFAKNRQNLSYWFTFDMNLQYEIYYHYLMQSFHETFQYFDKNREMFDSFVFYLLQKGFLKELDCLMTISRFKQPYQKFF